MPLPPPPPGSLQIVQVHYDHANPSADDGYEWVQIYNAHTSDVDLGGYSLGWGGTDYTYGGVDLVGIIPAGGCFIVGGPLTDAENGNPTYDQAANLTPDLQNSGNPGDGIALFDVPVASVTAGTCPIDAVIYGNNNSSGLMDESCSAGSVDVGDTSAGGGLLKDGPSSWTTVSQVDPSICPGSTVVLVDEDFSTCMPSGWTVQDQGEGNWTWECCDGSSAQGNCQEHYLNETGSPSGGYFAEADSDEEPTMGTEWMQEGLVTPSMDLSPPYGTVVLRFYHYYYYHVSQTGAVQYSTNGLGGPWTDLITYGPATEQGLVSLDVSSLIGFADVRFRFWYDDNDGWAWYWQIDDVKVEASYW
jgi:hypothetical protein